MSAELLPSIRLVYDKNDRVVYGDNTVESVTLKNDTGNEIIIQRIACAGPKLSFIECVVSAVSEEYSEIKGYDDKQKFIEQLLYEIKLYFATNKEYRLNTLKELDISKDTLYEYIDNREQLDDLLLENIAEILQVGIAVYNLYTDKIELVKNTEDYRDIYINIGKTKDRYELLGYGTELIQTGFDKLIDEI